MSANENDPVRNVENLQILIYIIITYRTLRIEISRMSGDNLRNTLDRWCQS
jgi:hypothetical protein